MSLQELVNRFLNRRSKVSQTEAAAAQVELKAPTKELSSVQPWFHNLRHTYPTKPGHPDIIIRVYDHLENFDGDKTEHKVTVYYKQAYTQPESITLDKPDFNRLLEAMCVYAERADGYDAITY